MAIKKSPKGDCNHLIGLAFEHEYIHILAGV